MKTDIELLDKVNKIIGVLSDVNNAAEIYAILGMTNFLVNRRISDNVSKFVEDYTENLGKMQ